MGNKICLDCDETLDGGRCGDCIFEEIQERLDLQPEEELRLFETLKLNFMEAQ